MKKERDLSGTDASLNKNERYRNLPTCSLIFLSAGDGAFFLIFWIAFVTTSCARGLIVKDSAKSPLFRQHINMTLWHHCISQGFSDVRRSMAEPKNFRYSWFVICCDESSVDFLPPLYAMVDHLFNHLSYLRKTTDSQSAGTFINPLLDRCEPAYQLSIFIITIITSAS